MRRLRGMVLVLLAVSLIGCDGDEPEPLDGRPRITGEVIISGSSTVYRISRAAQVRFAKRFGGAIKVLVDNRGTGGGFGRYLEGEVDLVDASRAARPEEESRARELGMPWTRFIVGYDGITVVVHPTNTFVRHLSVAQLRAIFSAESRVRTWRDLDPTWPDRAIILYTPDNDSGTHEFFREAILDGAPQRKDVQPSPEDNVLVTGVSNDEDALGYFGYAYYAANAAKLRALPIRNGPDAPPVAPSPKTILDQSYKPLARPLYVYAKNAAMARPAVARFLRFYIENVNDLTTRAMYVPPNAEDQAANLKALPPAPFVRGPKGTATP